MYVDNVKYIMIVCTWLHDYYYYYMYMYILSMALLLNSMPNQEIPTMPIVSFYMESVIFFYDSHTYGDGCALVTPG